VSLKIWRSGCQHLNLFPGKVSPVANLLRAGQRKRASERESESDRGRERDRERERERGSGGEEGRSRERVCASRCVLPRGVLQERACKSRDTFDFLNSRLPSVCRVGRGGGGWNRHISLGRPRYGMLGHLSGRSTSPSVEKPVIIINYAAASRKRARARARASAGRGWRGDTPRESEIERLRRRDS